MAVTNFDTINGQIVSEYTGTTQLDYLTDALGSVTGVCDQTGALAGSARFKPYGATLSSNGTQTSVGWVGSLGYRPTALAHCEFYVRRRHDSATDGRWTTVDPLWPGQGAYRYAATSPATQFDATGLQSGCPKWLPSRDCNAWRNYLLGVAARCHRLKGDQTPCLWGWLQAWNEYQAECNGYPQIDLGTFPGYNPPSTGGWHIRFGCPPFIGPNSHICGVLCNAVKTEPYSAITFMSMCIQCCEATAFHTSGESGDQATADCVDQCNSAVGQGSVNYSALPCICK